MVKLTYPMYVHPYFQLRSGGQEEYPRWLPVVAAARLVDEIPELDAMTAPAMLM